jgi:elongation factor G
MATKWVAHTPLPATTAVSAKVEVTGADGLARDLSADLTRRRAMILRVDASARETVITAMVPPADMLGYENALRSVSQGRARFEIRFDPYDTVAGVDDPDLFPPAVAMRA